MSVEARREEIETIGLTLPELRGITTEAVARRASEARVHPQKIRQPVALYIRGDNPVEQVRFCDEENCIKCIETSVGEKGAQRIRHVREIPTSQKERPNLSEVAQGLGYGVRLLDIVTSH